MPRAFSDHERESIRQALIDAGRDLFGSQGVTKTTVGELTRAAGISQGSFYKFFRAKEELWFEIMEHDHDRIRSELLAIVSEPPLTREKFSRLLRHAFSLLHSNPIIRRLYDDEDCANILRRLPPDRMQSHIQTDDAVFLPLLLDWQRQGIMVEHPPEVLSGLFRGMMMLTLHRREIGEDVYEQAMDLLIDLVVGGLIGRVER